MIVTLAARRVRRRRRTTRVGPALAIFAACSCVSAFAETPATRGTTYPLLSPADAQETNGQADPLAGELTVYPFTRPADVPRIVVSASPTDGGVSEGGERLIYSNILGPSVLGYGPSITLADDIHTTGVDGCLLSRYEILVSGNIDGHGSGPFSVDFALHDRCPHDGGQVIPGTAGHAVLPDAGTYLLEVRVPEAVSIPIPRSLWVRANFSRDQAGWVMGAPALVGHTDEAFLFSLFGCTVSLGQFPITPFGGFYVQLYARDDCPTTSLAYRAAVPTVGSYIPGAGVRVADDLLLETSTCRAIGYEVAVRGTGQFQFDLRLPDGPGGMPGEVIAGTEGTFASVGNHVQRARIPLDPPVDLPERLWFSAQTNTAFARLQLAGFPNAIGQTTSQHAVFSDGTWSLAPFPTVQGGAAMQITVQCEGSLPLGACCNAWFPDQSGEVYCREVPRINCPFGRWIGGATCEPEPFSPPCGLGACCLANGQCVNRTPNHCLRTGVKWHLDEFCGSPAVGCPFYCPATTASCSFPHAGVGCENHLCCQRICNSDPFCCEFEWDAACATSMPTQCISPPSHDRCAPSGRSEGAKLLRFGDVLEGDTLRASTTLDEPGFCCHGGMPPVCEGGSRDSVICTANVDCPGGECRFTEKMPGAQGHGTVWYRFEVPPKSAPHEPDLVAVTLKTCRSNAPATDSLIQVYSIGDSDLGVCRNLGRCADGAACLMGGTSCADGSVCRDSVESCSVSAGDCPAGAACVLDLAAACSSLSLMACGDDQPGCSSSGRNTDLCVGNLRRGQTYFVSVAAKTAQSRGLHRIEIDQVESCPGQTEQTPNDYCLTADPVVEGVTGFNLASAGQGCAADGCLSATKRDVWFEYRAMVDGRLLIESCPPDGFSAVRVAVYEGCGCPTVDREPLGCSAAGTDDCPLGSRVMLNVTAGQCYKIRVAGEPPGPQPGSLHILAAAYGTCTVGEVEWLDPPDGVVDARRPHDPLNKNVLHGIQRVLVRAPLGAHQLECWSACETTSTESPVALSFIEDFGDGTYRLELNRPIAAGAVTTLSYHGEGAPPAVGRFIAHPGNVNADAVVGPADILGLIDILNGTRLAPWGAYSTDIDGSGATLPADILEVIDLLNGAGAYQPWLGSPLPVLNGECP